MSRIIGHRGAKGLACENTLDGLKAAAAQGVRWVELDGVLTRDQVPVLLHDLKLDRLTTGQGDLDDLDFTMLQAIRVHPPAGVAGAEPQPLTTLAAALQEAARLGLGVNLEIKPQRRHSASLVLECFARVLATQPGLPLVLSSFSQPLLVQAQQRLPQLPRACLWEPLPSSWAEVAQSLAVHSVHLSADELTPQAVALVKAQGREVYVYTVNSVDLAKKFFTWGITGIFTDHPERFAEVLEQERRDYQRPFASPFMAPAASSPT